MFQKNINSKLLKETSKILCIYLRPP